MMMMSSRASVVERFGRRATVRGAKTTPRAGRELATDNGAGRAGRERARRAKETPSDDVEGRNDCFVVPGAARFACAAMVACAVTMSGGNASVAAEAESIDAQVQALYQKTLDVEDQYERAVEMNAEGVKPLDDDKDNDEFKSWNWEKLVKDAPATAAKTKTTRVRQAPTNATVRAQQNREENAAKLAQIKAQSAARTAEQDAKRAAQKKERDASAQAAVDARRAEKKAQLDARKRQAVEETAAARARRDAQRARVEALRAKTSEEKEAELKAFRSREAPSANAKKSPAARRAGEKKISKSYAAKETTKPKTTKPKMTKPKMTKPKATKKYSGSLDRNSLRNVRRQEYGAGAAPFAFVGLSAAIIYLLFQEEDD